MEVGSAKYWAFISYSHQDDTWARWLHRRLERYVVPRRLRAQRPDLPRRLYPVFRDREELPTSAHLSAVITEALHQSRFLIVICSPHAAASRWVDEEVRSFKRLHGDARVLAVIVDGEPHVAENPASGMPECFPPALRQVLDANGRPTGVRAEPLAADVRAGRDGRKAALQRILAGLLQVPYSELARREVVRRRWAWARNAVLATTLATAWIGLWFWQAERQHQREAVQQRGAQIDLARDELGNGESARAATLLADAYRRGDDSIDVRLLLARALPAVEALSEVSYPSEAGRWIVQLSYTPDQKRILVVEHDGDARLIDRASGQTVVRFAEPPPLPNYRFSADGRRLMLSGLGADVRRRQQVKVYAVDDGRLLLDAVGAPLSWPDVRAVFPAAIGDPALDRIALVNEQGEAELWTVGASSQAGVLRGARPLRSVGFSPDGSELVTADDLGGVVVWDADTRQARQRLQLRPATPAAAGYVGAHRILTLGETGTLNLWDAGSGEWQGALPGHSGRIELALPSLAHRRLVTGARDGHRVWDLATLKPLFAIDAALARARAAELDASGRWLLMAQADNKLRLQSVNDSMLAATLDGHVGAMYAAAVDATGRYAISGGSDGRIREWDLQRLGSGPLRVLGPRSAGGGRPRVLLTQFVDGGILSVDTQGHLCRWPIDESAAAACRPGDMQSLWSASADTEGQIAIGSADGHVEFVDATSTASRWRAALGSGAPVRTLSLDADGRWLAAAGDTGFAVWSTADGASLPWALERAGAVSVLGHAPDRDALLVGGDGPDLVVHALPGGERLLVLDGHDGAVTHAAYAADGSRLASVDRRGVLRVWSTRDGRVLGRFDHGERGGLQRLAFAHDGSRVAACGDGGVVLLHDLANGAVRELVGMPSGYCGDIVFSPDDQLLAATSVGGQAVVIWGADSGRRLLLWRDDALHPERLQFRDDSLQLAVSGEGWDQRFALLDLPREMRPAKEIEALVRCKSPWRLHDRRLAPVTLDRADCEKNLKGVMRDPVDTSLVRLRHLSSDLGTDGVDTIDANEQVLAQHF
jgi:WD40 repeat protein